MKFIFVHGIPGVGKLTVANELARITGFKVFHNHLTHDLVASIFEPGSDSYVFLKETIRLAIFRRAVDDQLPGLIFTFVFERRTSESFVKDIVEAVESGGGKVLFVELTSDESELAKRIRNPSRRKYPNKIHSMRQLKRYLRLGYLQAHHLPSPNFIIDTTQMTPSEVAQSIIDHFNVPKLL